jgi:hypothetical protein
MRVSNTPRRHSRSRNNQGRRNSNSPNNPYDNNKENKIKGNAIQVHERYQSMARDAISSGDIVKAEYYFQHAEHYHRIHKLALNIQQEKQQQNAKKIVPINKEEDKKEDLEENNIQKNSSDKIPDAAMNRENNNTKIEENKNNIQK